MVLLLVICIAGWLRVKWEKREDRIAKRAKQMTGDFAGSLWIRR
jgi:hypothetical protein